MKAQFYKFGCETVERKARRKPDGLNANISFQTGSSLFHHQDFRNIMDPTHSLITKLQNQKNYTMKFLVIWNVVIKTLTQFFQICRSLWISRQQHKIPDWVQMGFNFAGNQYLVSSMQQYSTATQQKLSSRSFAVPKLITSVALQHAKLTVYTKKETKGKTWTCTRYNKNKQAFI